jgi:hypothetical protein
MQGSIGFEQSNALLIQPDLTAVLLSLIITYLDKNCAYLTQARLSLPTTFS